MYNKVEVVHIVAVDNKNCIGVDNSMPWHLPEDLKRFKELTSDGVVLMGRKTFESLGCKALPNRLNIVLTSDDKYLDNEDDYDVTFLDDLNDAMLIASSFAKQAKNNKIWIIGGAEIYKQTMRYVDTIEVTIVGMGVNGDAFYPSIPEINTAQEIGGTRVDEKSGIQFQYVKINVNKEIK